MKKISIILGILCCLIFVGIVLYKINTKGSNINNNSNNEDISNNSNNSNSEYTNINEKDNTTSVLGPKKISISSSSKQNFKKFQDNLINPNKVDSSLSDSSKEQSPYYKMAVNAIKLIGEGKKEQGINELNEILKKDPKNELALEGLGLFYLEEGRNFDKALGYFQKMVEINPTNPTAISEVAYVIEESQGLEKAESYLKDLLEKNQNSPAIASTLAQTLVRAGRDEDAIQYLEIAAQAPSKPGEPNYAREDLAYTYMKTGNYQEATKNYRIIVSSKQTECDNLNNTQNIRRELLDGCNEDLTSKKIDLANSLIQYRHCDEAGDILRDIENRTKDDPGLKNIFKELMEKCQ
ncbi:MAG: tetratricopeptide repeat protein [Oligoflexia bacterium]|nr:tetratricopeptide repeat protein [Oligoflexia bacterium]